MYIICYRYLMGVSESTNQFCIGSFYGQQWHCAELGIVNIPMSLLCLISSQQISDHRIIVQWDKHLELLKRWCFGVCHQTSPVEKNS